MDSNFCRGQVSIEFVITALIIIGLFSTSMFVFQSRMHYNNETINKWNAELVAFRLASNINQVGLTDGNVTVSENFEWNFGDKNIVFEDEWVDVYWGEGKFVSQRIYPNSVDFQVTSFNGEIIFEKTSEGMVVRNA